MKKSILFLLLFPFLLNGCSSNPEDSSNTTGGNDSPSTDTEEIIPTDEDGFPTEYVEEITSIQDTTILHAWDWKLNDIKSRLSKIKKCGYKTIQISPMQPNVDKVKWVGESTQSQWWKLYQPLAYKVATDGESMLGTKEELTSLCLEAKNYGISIIVDIVANHLAGSNGTYNGDVYTKYQQHTLNHDVDDGSVQYVTQGRVGGLPDVDTSLSTVQNDVGDMLCEYLSCGVKGFRFDAAKHIETPDDGAYSSNFWPNVLGKADQYAETNGLDKPYYYGEILNTCGTGRSYSSYTKYMSVIDNKNGENVIGSIKNLSAGNMTSFPTGESADKLVLWAESHDTYCNKGSDRTDNVSYESIRKAYVVQASRKDAASLFYARPENMNVTFGSIYENGWLASEVIASNYFHRLYNKKAENISISDNCFINVRGEEGHAGACIVNLSSQKSKTLTISSLSDGTYIDLSTGNELSITGGVVNASFTNGTFIIVPKSLDPHIEYEQSTEYSSNIVIKGADANKTYWLYTWNNSTDATFTKFSVDNDAIGANTTKTNYIIVEANAGVTSMDWSKKIRQTNDLVYSGTQVIYNFSSIQWK